MGKEQAPPKEVECSSSSSPSDESLSTGSPRGVAEAPDAPEEEVEHMAGDNTGHLGEEATADYWVVESDRISRVHATPRYWLYTHDAASLPVPIEYIDVLRYTKTNATGHNNLVDCWVSDTEQIPGHRVGTTSFNLRLPAPKPGWVMQMDAPPGWKPTAKGQSTVGVRSGTS